MAEQPLHPVVRSHLRAMTGPLGIWQHATGSTPNQAFGVCSDDVARALIVDLRHADVLGWDAVADDAWRSLRFLGDAYDPAWRRFRNFRGADGGWARSDPSDDTQGRVLLALAESLGHHEDPHFAARARGTFAAALPGIRRLRALRGMASGALACVAALDGLAPTDPLHQATARMLDHIRGLLRWAFVAEMSLTGDPAWPWPEPVLTYENALVPRAMIVVGHRLGDGRMERQGLASLDWLIATGTSSDGRFSPVGSNGWWPRGGQRARFDQQPIEAAALLLACRAALDATGQAGYRVAAEAAYAWFLGVNDVGIPVAIPAAGACHDGLGHAEVNHNQGAESTLSWLLALETMRAIRAGDGRAVDVPAPVPGRPRALGHAVVAGVR